MIESIIRFKSPEPIYVICNDSLTFKYVSSLPYDQVIAVELAELENVYPELQKAKSDRTLIEYYYCLTPFLIDFCIRHSGADIGIYVDSDIAFFSNPENALLEFNDNFEVAIVPHRFAAEDEYLSRYGLYNVGWVAFRNSQPGLKVLNWWKQKCRETTSVIPTAESFGDQKYLDFFDSLGVPILKVRGIGNNAGPWNCKETVVTVKEEILFNDEELIYYHFSGLRIFPFVTRLGFAGYSYRPSRNLRNKVYKPYIRSLSINQRKFNLSSVSKFDSLTLKEWLREIFFLDLIINRLIPKQ